LSKGEKRLWKAVIVSALNDVAKAKTNSDLAKAVMWFRSQQASDICLLINVDYTQVKRIVFDLSKRSCAQRIFWMKEVKEKIMAEK
jgi:hypothetical protein